MLSKLNNEINFEYSQEIKDIITSIIEKDIFSYYQYILYLSIHCIKCITLLSGIHEEQKELIDKRIIIILDSTKEEYRLVKEIYSINIPMISTAEYDYLDEFKNLNTPSLYKLSDNKIGFYIKEIKN
ncbi:MAG: hypothetical protein AB9856_13900 [Cellulosilyticaceae bacterium]